MSSVNDTSKEALIADMQKLLAKHTKVTRDFYRKEGAYPELYRKYFPTFTDFVAAASGHTSDESVQQTFHDDKWDLSLVSRIKSLDELVKQFDVDLGVWQVERFIANKWEMGYTTGPQEDKVASYIPLYQVKATFVKKQNIVDARAEIEDLKKAAKLAAHLPPVVVKSGVKSKNCLEML